MPLLVSVLLLTPLLLLMSMVHADVAGCDAAVASAVAVDLVVAVDSAIGVL